jgi:hypothetical protein
MIPSDAMEASLDQLHTLAGREISELISPA